MKKRKKSDRVVKNVLQVGGILVKLGVIGLMVYTVVNRLQDVNGIEFFFTTWR